MKKHFHHFFDPEQIGASLKEMNIKSIENGEDRVLSRWFHGGEDADLFIWIDPMKNIIKHQVTFSGQIVEWNILDGVRTGMIIEQELKDSEMIASEMIHFDSSPQKASVNLAIDVIHHVKVLEQQVRTELLEQLQTSRSLSQMRPKDVTRRYGNGFWNKFRLKMRKIFS